MQENKEPDKPEDPDDKEKTAPELEELSFSKNAPEPEFEEQIKEPSVSENANESEFEEQIKEPSVSENANESEFEEQQGEVLLPEKKKRSGCGFILFILLILTGAIGYLYYTDQIPRQIIKEIKPILKPLQPQLTKLKPQLAPQNSKKRILEVENEIPDPKTQKNIKKTPFPVEEHISGFEMESTLKADEGIANYTAEVSGNTTQIAKEPETLVKKPKVENQTFGAKTEIHRSEAQINEVESEVLEVEKNKEETLSVSPVMAPTQPPFQKPVNIPFEETTVEEKPSERNEAVRAYLNFVESTLIKAGELVKKGFTKGKNFLMKSLG